MRTADLVTDLLDLVLARACLDCEEPGHALCSTCLRGRRGRVLHEVLPSGLAVTAALDYASDGRELVIAYKEHGTRALAPMLGVLLADAVAAARATAQEREFLLVPVPSHRRSRRGFDALGGIVRHATPELRARGLPVRVARPVRGRGAYAPLKQLGRDERRVAVQGAFTVDARVVQRMSAEPLPLLIVDDVVTTGATVDRLAALLSAAGLSVSGAAAVALVSPGRPGPTPAPARPTLRR